MENLSSEDLSLLLAIYREPNQRLSMYGHKLRVTYKEILVAQNNLLQKGLVFEQNSGRLLLNLTAIETQNLKIILENGETPDVEPEPLETETVQKFEDVDNKVLEMLKARPQGCTAKELAAPFGTKGTSLNWTLRSLMKKNLVVKRDVKYYLAEECDKVVSIPVIVDDRREVTTDFELRTFILGLEGERTQEEFHTQLAKLYKFDREKFCEVFTDLVLDGYFNVHDGDGYVQHDLDYSPDNKHERCVNVNSDQGVGELVNDFLCVRDGNGFTLRTIVKATSLRHDLIIKHLTAFNWDVSNPMLLQRAKPKTVGYTKFDEIDVNAARQLIFGIVKIDVFIKRFNLDPATKDEVVKLLELVKMAKFDAASGFLGPVKHEPAKEESFAPAPVEKVEPVAAAPDDTVMTNNGEVVRPKDLDVGATLQSEIGTEIQNEEDADDIAPVDGGIVDYDPEPVIEIERERGRKFISPLEGVQVSAPTEVPTHVDIRTSPLYGHKILGLQVADDISGNLKVASEPDLEWIAAQPDATDIEKAMALLTRENMIGILKKRYPMRAIELDEIDPSQPVEVTMEMDWESLKSPDSFEREPVPEPATIMDTVRDGFHMLDKAQVLELLAELQDKVSDPKAEPEKKNKSFAELWELQDGLDEKRKCWCNKPEHDLRRGECGPSGVGGPGTAYPHPIGPSGKSGEHTAPKEIVNPQWSMTLQMLAERFQHEHQYTTAQILRDIHDYLAPK